MSLQLFELVPSRADRAAAQVVLERIGKIAASVRAELVESQVTADHRRVFAVVEAGDEDILAALRSELTAANLAGEAVEVTGPHEVRLVGADLAELKAARPEAGYLVEWDLPADLDMDGYLARKKAAAPRYADVPEASFLRTYVREDLQKCLCFYDAPDEQVVRAARKAVDTPVDRLHALDDPGAGR
jgi:Protein of unknown function (DUF4242)